MYNAFKGALYQRLSRGDIDAPNNSSTPGLLPDRPPTPGGHPIAPPETPPPAAGAAGGAGHEGSREQGPQGEKLFCILHPARRACQPGLLPSISRRRGVWGLLRGVEKRGSGRKGEDQSAVYAAVRFIGLAINRSYTTLFAKRHALTRVSAERPEERQKGRRKSAHQERPAGDPAKAAGKQKRIYYSLRRYRAFPYMRISLFLSGFPYFTISRAKKKPPIIRAAFLFLLLFFFHLRPNRAKNIAL